MIKTDIVLHPYLLITQRGAFKIYIFDFKKDGGFFSCDTRISPRTAISTLFSKPVTSQIFLWYNLPGYQLRKKVEITVLGLKSVSPGVDASI